MPNFSATETHAFQHPAPHLAEVHLVYSGKDPRLSNFLGMYGIPMSSSGRWYWWAVDGDHGQAETVEECLREIRSAWDGAG